MQQDKTPIYKVGAIVMRDVATSPQFLLVKPKAKTAGEEAPWVLPRGSRQYQQNGVWCDARTREDALAHADATWESFERAITRELEEEAGVTPAMLATSTLSVLGARLYHAKHSGKEYVIHWHVVRLDETRAAQIKNTAADSQAVAWFTLEQLKTLIAKGEAREGYLAIVEEALAH